MGINVCDTALLLSTLSATGQYDNHTPDWWSFQIQIAALLPGGQTEGLQVTSSPLPVVNCGQPLWVGNLCGFHNC